MNMLKIVFLALYGPIFAAAIVGNTLLLVAVYKRKRLRTPVNIFLVNVATSDLLFGILSAFQAVEFVIEKWALGDVYCRIYGTIIEVSYTVSVLTLSIVAVERYLSICRRNSAAKHTRQKCVIVAVSIWGVSILFCSPLFYGWTAKADSTGNIRCGSTYWTNKSKLIFYGIHTVLVYLLPLIIMITTHAQLFRFLITKTQVSLKETYEVDNSNADNTERRSKLKSIAKQLNRNKKVMRILFTVTLVFFILWTPFILSRLLKYCNIAIPRLVWNISQFLMIVSTAVNFFIYSFMSPELRKAFRSFLPCKKKSSNAGQETSASSETQM